MIKRLFFIAYLLIPSVIFSGEIKVLSGDITIPLVRTGAKSGAPSLVVASVNLIDALNEKQAGIFQYHSTETIHRIGIVPTTTVTPGFTADIRLETVDTTGTGFPTGTLYCANSSATVMIAAANVYALSNALGADCKPTLDDTVAVVVVHSGNSLSTRIGISASDVSLDYGYVATSNTTAGYVRGIGPPNILFTNPSDNYFGVPFVTSYTTITSTASTAGARWYGNSYTLPIGVVVSGFMFWADNDTGYKASLYSGGTELETVSYSTVTRSSGGGIINYHNFASTHSFKAGETFRIVASSIAPSGTGATVFYIFNSTSTQQYNSNYDWGSSIKYTQSSKVTPSSESDFIDFDGRRGTMYAIISAIVTPQRSSASTGP